MIKFLSSPKYLLVCLHFIGLTSFVNAQTQFQVYWGTQHADDTSPALGEDYGLGTTGFKKYLLKSLDVDGTTPTSLVDNTDLIELGFFNIKESSGVYSGSPTDSNADQSSDYSPNTDSSNPFKGIWTPLTSLTKIGRDWDSDVVPAGEFYYHSVFPKDSEATETSEEGGTHNGLDSYTSFSDNLGSSITGAANTNDLEDRVLALYAEGNPVMLGIRFYDTGSKSSGTSRYNTIMSTDWTLDWDSGSASEVTAVLDFLTYDSGTNSVSLNNNLTFEFDNPSYGSISKIGKGGNSVDANINGSDANEDKFVSTITYYDGSGTLDLDDDDGVGHSVLSGLNSGGTINVGDDNVGLTLNAVSGSTYQYTGTISEGGSEGQANIIKTGTGEQLLIGSVKLAANDSNTDSGFLDIYEGTLTLKPASAGTQKFEYLKNTSGGSGTPVLKLDNTSLSDGDELVQLGFAKVTSASFSGNVLLDGRSNSEIKVKISDARADGTFASDDYVDKQTISGVISSANGDKTLVKSGVGTLSLTGDNTFSGGVRIEDGTLSVGHADALGTDSNTVTIKSGKLEVANTITLNNTYTIATDDSGKSMIGGRGDLNNAVTIGSANSSNFVDVISPGDGISSSLSSSSTQQQVSLGERTNAIGTFTISDTLTLASGGVYDWEISDFTNAGNDTKAGVDWDLLKFDTLTYNPNDTFTINIMGLAANGTAGAMSGGNVWGSFQEAGGAGNGFKFMEFTGTKSWSADPGAGTLSNFSIQDDGWQYYNSHHLNEWSVYWDGVDSFYLQYSAVPEPSTYMMVTGLLMVPGMSYVRRLRRKKNGDLETKK